jgi:hypothetical protein
MGNWLYVWLGGIAILFAIEVYLYRRLLQNLAPGVQRSDVWRPNLPPGQRGGKLAAFIEPKLFNATGQEYRRRLVWNESIYAVWIFVAGPIFAILGKS